MNHIRVIFRKLIRSRLVGVPGHIRKKITPVNDVPTLVQKDEGLGRTRGGQSGRLDENAIRTERRQTTIGAGESAEVKIHRSAADSGPGRAVHGNVARVRGTPIDGGVSA